MKKRFWLIFVVLAVLSVVGVLLLRFASLGAPAGTQFSMDTAPESVSAADKQIGRAHV